jgi:hypothetical protein
VVYDPKRGKLVGIDVPPSKVKNLKVNLMVRCFCCVVTEQGRDCGCMRRRVRPGALKRQAVQAFLQALAAAQATPAAGSLRHPLCQYAFYPFLKDSTSLPRVNFF